MRYVYTAITSLVSAILLAVLGDLGSISLFTVLLGLAFGIVTALQSVFYLKAFEIGPFSYTTVIVTLSTIIPTLSGCIFWDEKISIPQIIGIILMVVCMILSVDFGTDRLGSVRWLIYTLIAFLATGIIGVFQKWHQSTEYSSELDVFLVIAFAVSFLFSLGAAFVTGGIRGTVRDVGAELSAKRLLLIVISGACVAVNNKINLYLSGVMDSAVFFPVVNGGGLLLNAIASVVVFREHLGVKKWVGIGIGILALLLLIIKF